MKFIIPLTLLFNFIFTSDQIPGPPQDHPIIFTGATIHTVSHGVLENAEILFDGGKIISVGQNLSAMYKIEKINNSGHWVHAENPDAFYAKIMKFI